MKHGIKANPKTALSEELVTLAQQIADDTPRFFEIKGPGKGDNATNEFMKELKSHAKQLFREDYSEKGICGDNKFAVDFFFPKEATIVEIALTLRNANSEFSKDILKAILSQKAGNSIKKLIFVSKPGAIKRHEEPASKSIISLVKKEFGISVIIRELNNNQIRVDKSHSY
jgi:hypothetical protein